jgi:glycosyltransferase involved in cell wall biosynthesis
MGWLLYVKVKTVETYPKISCVMVTAGRPDKIRRSIRCYLRQIYPDKELIILSQGKENINKELSNYVKSLELSDIYFFTAPENLSLGGMRNLGVELTHGDIICQWDDDDLSHPFRLAKQFNALSADGVLVSAYQEHLKWFEDTNEIYWIDWSVEVGEDRRYLHGTSMYRKETFCDCGNMLYPEVGPQSGREEDWNAIKKILGKGRIAGIREGYHYIYTYHGDNIYWRSHHELVLRKRVYTKDELLARKLVIELALRECGVDRQVRVCSNDGVAFEFSPEI